MILWLQKTTCSRIMGLCKQSCKKNQLFVYLEFCREGEVTGGLDGGGYGGGCPTFLEGRGGVSIALLMTTGAILRANELLLLVSLSPSVTLVTWLTPFVGSLRFPFPSSAASSSSSDPDSSSDSSVSGAWGPCPGYIWISIFEKKVVVCLQFKKNDSCLFTFWKKSLKFFVDIF